MKLDNFPTNVTAQEMMEMITGNGFYDKSYVAKWLFQVMGMEIEEAKQLFEELREQMFPETATWGIIYHEQKYGIPSSDLLSLEDRRKKVIQKRDIRAPMNPARLEIITTNHTGLPCTVTDPADSYVFDISIDFPEETDISVIKGLYEVINRLKPSHLSYNVTADVENVVFKNMNTANLLSLLMAYEFYTNQSCRTEILFFEIYHKYQSSLGYKYHEYFILPMHRQEGNMHKLEFKAAQINVLSYTFPKLEIDAYFKTKNTNTCMLKKDTMFTFDGSILFDGTRRFNANIIEEVI